MRPLLSPTEMAAADRAAIERGMPVEALMERAGRAVARAAIEAAGGRYGRRAVVVCGKGNNGGDGYVAARVLAREGMAAVCLTTTDAGAVAGAARHHLERMVHSGVAVEGFERRRLQGAAVVVDAIFGTGFRGAPEGRAAEAIEAINASGARVVSVDIPSGVDGATGRAEGLAVRADVTVAMGAEKLGTALHPGTVLAGDVRVADIGIPIPGAETYVAEARDVASLLPRRPVDAHKRSAGSIAVLGGTRGMSGALVLALRGALRGGGGYATAGVTRDVAPAVAQLVPEALSRIVTDEPFLGPEALDALSDVLARADSVAIGPGLGRGDRQTALLNAALERVEAPVVVDADGLNVLAVDTSMLERRRAPTVLTPHPAELARLLQVDTKEVQADRVGRVREAAARFGCTVLLKGFRTLVAAPERPTIVNPTGTPALATAGTGDVLTGVVAALLAARLDAFDAAFAAAFLHGAAGEVAAARLQGEGVIAGDVADALPGATAAIRAGGLEVRRP